MTNPSRFATSGRSFPWIGAICLMCLVALAACDTGQGTAERRVAEQAPGDSLAKLTRRVLEAEDPVRAMEAWKCESMRLIELYGPVTATDIIETVEDTIYKRDDQAARRRVDSALAHRVLRTNCPSQ
jgi:hypothetical protein